MGVPGLWDLLRPAGRTHSLTHLAVVDGFEANPDGVRGLRVGIDASIWFYHATYGREGENPELRTLFFRCTRLMSAPFLPLFVFDGPKRPDYKRGKRVSGKDHWMVQGMQAMINAFGFEWIMAPGEAEAELAYLNRIGVIDAVLSDDVDTFLFGATMMIRNPSTTLTGNKAHALKNSDGRDDGNHVATYRASDLESHPDVQLTQGGLILIGILRGGDYHQAGLTGCGPTIAHGLARCGFGDTLLAAAKTLSREQLPGFLTAWRQELREELRTNSQKRLGRKSPSLAKAIPETFPDLDVLLSYTHPITSESRGRGSGLGIDWEKEPDLGKIAGLCEMYFEWGVKEIIIKRFRTVLWPSAVLRILRRAALLEDRKVDRTEKRANQAVVPSTPRKVKQGRATPIGTPSKMIAKHFSALQLGTPSASRQSPSENDDGEEERLIVKIHSSRNHASTDGLLEYRLEVAPGQLVRLCEAGVRGLRTAVSSSLDASDFDEEENDSDSSKRKTKKPPPDPQSHLRIWLPACMVRLVEPELVEDFEEITRRKEEKKAKKGTSKAKSTNASSKPSSPKKTKARRLEITEEESSTGFDSDNSAPDSAISRAKLPSLALRVTGEEEDDDTFFSTPRKPEPAIAKNRTVKSAAASVEGLGLKPGGATAVKSSAATAKASDKGKRKPDPKPPVKSNTAKVSALFDNPPLASSSSRPSTSSDDYNSNRPSISKSPSRSRILEYLSRTESLLSSTSATTTTASSSTTSLTDPTMASTSRALPRPFPISFDGPVLSDESLSDSPPKTVKPKKTVQARQRSPVSPKHKSPRKNIHHTSPRKMRPPVRHSGTEHSSDDKRHERPSSPSPLRARTSAQSNASRAPPSSMRTRNADISVIEISSDSDSATPARAAPLLIAKARVRATNPTRKKNVRAAAVTPEDIIDLT